MSAFLSDIELYFAPAGANADNLLILLDEEAKHCARVMRHKPGDMVYCTDGKGNLYTTEVAEISSQSVTLNMQSRVQYPNRLGQMTVVLPVLRSPDRMEFALEKCTELGVTRFMVYAADRSVAKGMKTERWEKIVHAAMKQSLQMYLPVISTPGKLKDVLKVSSNEGAEVVYFHQQTEIQLKDHSFASPHYLVFGPEGGFSENELYLLSGYNGLQLTSNRLRAETAITSALAAIVLK